MKSDSALNLEANLASKNFSSFQVSLVFWCLVHIFYVLSDLKNVDSRFLAITYGTHSLSWSHFCSHLFWNSLVNPRGCLAKPLSVSWSHILLTQYARIRVPVVSMKIEKFKDLFRAALDRWLDSHESKNFGFGRTRRPIRPIFSAILPILGKI